MKILVIPKEMPEMGTPKSLGDGFRALDEEWQEVKQAAAEYVTNPTPKNREHLMEEYGDLITVTLNNMLDLEKQDPLIKDMVWAELQKVALKNYCRGYHHDLTGILKDLMGR